MSDMIEKMSGNDLLDYLYGGATKKAAAKKKTPAKKASAKKAPAAKKASPAKKSAPSGAMTGKVVSYNPRNAYGFIHDEEKNVDYFFHKSAIAAGDMDKLQAGDMVSYTLLSQKSEECKKGNCAINVAIVKKGGMRGGSMAGAGAGAGASMEEAALFQRLLSLSQENLEDFASRANVDKSVMVGGGKKKLSKLALVNLLLQ